MSVRPVLVSILIPVYNEAPYIAEVVQRVRDVPLPLFVSREIVLVDDGSTDGTTELVRSLASPDVRVVVARRNGGKGIAIRRGIEEAKGEVILLQDADLEYDPADHPRVLAPILDGVAEIVYGSRFRGRIVGMAWPNRLANVILCAITNVLYGAAITDEATAYKAFRAEILRGMAFRARRFEWCPEVTARSLLAGHRIVEVPIAYRARSVAQGKKIRWWDLLHAIWTLLRYRVPGQAGRVSRSALPFEEFI